MTQLHELHIKKVRGFLLRGGCLYQDAEELAQDTFVLAFRKLGTFDESRDFRSWLYGIARHQLLNHYKKRQKQRALFATEPPPDIWDRHYNLEKRCADSQLGATLWAYAEKWVRLRTPDHAELILDRLQGTPEHVLVERYHYSDRETLRTSLPQVVMRALVRSSDALEAARAWVEAYALLVSPHEFSKPLKFLDLVDLDKVKSADIA